MPFSRNVLWTINVTEEENFLNNQDLSHLVMISFSKSARKKIMLSVPQKMDGKKSGEYLMYMHAENKV